MVCRRAKACHGQWSVRRPLSDASSADLSVPCAMAVGCDEAHVLGADIATRLGPTPRTIKSKATTIQIFNTQTTARALNVRLPAAHGQFEMKLL
jgi:hypothetical protein